MNVRRLARSRGAADSLAGIIRLSTPQVNLGVIKSTDGAGSWTPLNSGLVTTFVSDIATDPVNPAVLYAASTNAPQPDSDDWAACQMEDPSMRFACVAVLLLLLTAGCAHVTLDTPDSEPRDVATQPGTPKPVAKPASPATPQPAPAAAPAPSARTAAPKAAITAAPPIEKTPAVNPALDLATLEVELKATKAIGIFTKLTLKNQVDDLLDQFREYHNGKVNPTMNDLRRYFDLLMMKVLSLLQDADQELASAIVSSREAIWGLLADSKKFAAFQA